jgi:hypothetical protein
MGLTKKTATSNIESTDALNELGIADLGKLVFNNARRRASQAISPDHVNPEKKISLSTQALKEEMSQLKAELEARKIHLKIVAAGDKLRVDVHELADRLAKYEVNDQIVDAIRSVGDKIPELIYLAGEESTEE